LFFFGGDILSGDDEDDEVSDASWSCDLSGDCDLPIPCLHTYRGGWGGERKKVESRSWDLSGVCKLPSALNACARAHTHTCVHIHTHIKTHTYTHTTR